MDWTAGVGAAAPGGAAVVYTYHLARPLWPADEIEIDFVATTAAVAYDGDVAMAVEGQRD